MIKLFKEPLLHFLLIGAGLFWLYALVNPQAATEGDRQIVVSTGRIEQLLRIFEKTWQRPPSADELKGLIDDFIIEEMYYRQGVAMGIDKDDTLIRRRLRQKVEFLTDDTADLINPDDKQLEAYLAENREKFRRESVYTFRQIYFNPERHGDDPAAFVRQQLAALRSGKEVASDSGLIPETFEEASSRMIDRTFGIGFALKLEPLPVGEWSGPLSSGLGTHLVMMKSSKEGKIPTLAEIRPLVKREWANEKRLQIRKEFNDRLLGNYDITIEWPEKEAAAKDSE